MTSLRPTFSLLHLRNSPAVERLSQLVEWVSPEPSEKEGEGSLSRHCGCVMMIFLIAAERDETRISGSS